jgi:hypothetical protein
MMIILRYIFTMFKLDVDYILQMHVMDDAINAVFVQSYS